MGWIAQCFPQLSTRKALLWPSGFLVSRVSAWEHTAVNHRHRVPALLRSLEPDSHQLMDSMLTYSRCLCLGTYFSGVCTVNRNVSHIRTDSTQPGLVKAEPNLVSFCWMTLPLCCDSVWLLTAWCMSRPRLSVKAKSPVCLKGPVQRDIWLAHLCVSPVGSFIVCSAWDLTGASYLDKHSATEL